MSYVFSFSFTIKDTVSCQDYRGADKSLARPDLKKQLKGRHFSSDAELSAAAETWLDNLMNYFFWVVCRN